MRYNKLDIDFEIPAELQDVIEQYVTYLNNSDGSLDDCYRTEIQLELNHCYRNGLLSAQQIELLRDYYQRQGIKRG